MRKLDFSALIHDKNDVIGCFDKSPAPFFAVSTYQMA